MSVRQPRVRDRGDGASLHVGDPAALSAPRGRPFAMAVSEGHFHRRLRGSLGRLLGSLPGLSASTITRLKEVGAGNGATSLAKRYVYFWVDGIYFSARMEEEKRAWVGATDKGQKELIAMPTAIAKVSGSKFCSISSGAALKWVRNWRSATARSASGGAPPSLPRRPRATLLGSQDGQRLEQAAGRQGAPARHLDGRNQEGCRERLRLLPGSTTGRSTTRPRPWPRTATSC